MFDSGGPSSLLDQYTSNDKGGSLLDKYSSNSGGSIFDQKSSGGSVFSQTSASDLVSSGRGSPFDSISPLKGASVFDTLTVDKHDPYSQHSKTNDSVFANLGSSQQSIYDSQKSSSPFDSLGQSGSVFDVSSSQPSSIYDSKTSSPFDTLSSSYEKGSSYDTPMKNSSPFDVLSQDSSDLPYVAANYYNSDKPKEESYMDKYKKDEPAKKGGLFSKDKPKQDLFPKVKLEKNPNKEESEESPQDEEKPWASLDKKHVVTNSKAFQAPESKPEQTQSKEDSLFVKKVKEVATQMSDEKLFELDKKLKKELEDGTDMKKELKLKAIQEIMSDRRKLF